MNVFAKRVFRATAAYGLVSAAALGSVATAGDGSFAMELRDKDQPFEAGHSCAELAYLTEGELKEALNPAFQSDFMAFCHPEEPETCEDYLATLRGLGRLAPGDDGYHCRFIPLKKGA